MFHNLDADEPPEDHHGVGYRKGETRHKRYSSAFQKRMVKIQEMRLSALSQCEKGQDPEDYGTNELKDSDYSAIIKKRRYPK